MENNELQKIWKAIDSEVDHKSKEELNLLLKSKARQTINKYLIIIGFSVIVCFGLIIFLLITSLNRLNDLIYLFNNAVLGLMAVISLISGLFSWYKLQNKKCNQSLKSWLKARIDLLSGWLTGKYRKLYLFLIPLLYVLTVFSIHVYYENKKFIEVLNTEESVIALLIAAPIGLFVSYYSAIKIRKYQSENLRFLKDLYSRLSNL